MTRIIFVNGPPRSGKDTAGELLCDFVTGAVAYKFARVLKIGTHALFDAIRNRLAYPLDCLIDDNYEAVKDDPQPEFFAKTPRQAYIAVSETLLKPMFGEQFFGEILRDQILRDEPECAVITDSGFLPEAVPIIEQFGVENCALIWMRRDGCDFSSDSRSYLEIPSILPYDIANNGTIRQLRTKLASVVW